MRVIWNSSRYALRFNIYLFLVNCRSNWLAHLVDFSELGEHLPSDSSVLIFVSTILQEPTSTSNELLPCRRFKLVGPTGWSADQGGRPATQSAQPTSAFFDWVKLWAYLSLARGLSSSMSVSCSGGPSNLCFDTCRVLILWNIVSWIMSHH